LTRMMSEIYAVFLRDWMKKDKLWKTMMYLSVMVAIVYFLGFGIEKIVSLDAFQNYASFFTFGMLIYFVIYGGIVVGAEIILDLGGYMKVLLVAPISKYSILLGKVISIMIGTIRFYFIIGLAFLVVTQNFSLVRMLIIPFYIILTLIIGISIGLLLSTITTDRKTNEFLIGSSSFALLLLSGIIFPTTSLPAPLQLLLKINPIIYITDGFRHLMIGQGEFNFILDMAIALGAGLLLAAISVRHFDKAIRR
jgi:ABC-2 type transport system permease protein